MTSLISQTICIPPSKHYIVENNGGHMLKTLTFGDIYFLNPNTILSDMENTAVMSGYIYRKVQIVTATDDISSGNQIGYICLNSDQAPLFNGNSQGVTKMD